jgi:GT2 family glycosyltransferase
MGKVFEVSASIVLFKNDPIELKRAMDSFLNTTLRVRLYLIDNSPTPALSNLAKGDHCEYIFNNNNIGFGKAHNIAFQKIVELSEFHIVLNPDVSFEAGTLEAIYSFMKANPEVGLLLPKVYNEEGQMQYLAKLLPRPVDLIFRRFLPESWLKFFGGQQQFELRMKDYNQIIEAPYLSGCFMFVRTEALKKSGFFDPRFFMYMEDIDFSRRINEHFKTLYYPGATIIHGHAKASYKNLNLLKIHIISGIQYFNKYGWFFDKPRRIINKEALAKEQDLRSFL